MSRYLIAIHRVNNGDRSFADDKSMRDDIDVLNHDMVAAGVRIFVGGLQSIDHARSVRRQADGTLVEGIGPFLANDDYVDGFWVLDVADQAAAMLWGRRAAVACRASVEVRLFY